MNFASRYANVLSFLSIHSDSDSSLGSLVLSFFVRGVHLSQPARNAHVAGHDHIYGLLALLLLKKARRTSRILRPLGSLNSLASGIPQGWGQPSPGRNSRCLLASRFRSLLHPPVFPLFFVTPVLFSPSSFTSVAPIVLIPCNW